MIRFTLLCCGLLFTGCATKTNPVLYPMNQAPTTLAVTQIDMASGAPVAPPETLSSRLNKQLERNGYVVTNLPVDQLPSDFTRRRLATHKAQAIAQDSEDLVILVEAVARFYSQLRGQYRWEVSVETTLLNPKAPEEAIVDQFTIPVFLRFQHEKEAEALAASGVELERRLQRLLDDVATLSVP